MEDNKVIEATFEEVVEPIVVEPFKVEVGNLIKVTPGKRHACYESNVGKIRKPL